MQKKLLFFRPFLISIGSVLFGFGYLGAIEKKSSNSKTIDADSVLVTSNRIEEDAHKSVKTVRVITDRDIEETPASNVGDLLKDIPGITTYDSGLAGMRRISIRGESASRTLILIDGIKVFEQKSMNGTPILIDLSDIKRIEVISGSSSVLYGSEAIGGVINIITKKGGKRPIQVEGGIGYDSSSSLLTTRGAIYGSAKGFDYRFGGSWTHSKNRVLPGEEKIPFTSFTNYGFNSYIAYNWKDGKFYVRQQHYGSTSDVNEIMRLPHWDRDRVSLVAEQMNLGPLSKLNVSATYQRSFKDWITYPLQIQNTQHEAHVIAQTDWQLPWQNLLIAGIEYNFTFLESKQGVINLCGDELFRVNSNHFGIFAHDKWQILPDFALLAGLRYSHALNILNKIINEAHTPLAKSFFSKNQANSVAGSFGFLWDIGKSANFRFRYGNGFKNPEVSKTLTSSMQMNKDDGGNVFPIRIIPNKKLRPEISHNFELGARYFGNGLDIDGSLSYNLGTDYIAMLELKSLPGEEKKYTYLNINTSHSLSVEGRFSYTIPVIDLMPYFNIAYQYIHYIKGDWNSNKTGTPPWQIKGGFRFEKEVHPLVRLQADGNFVWNSEARSENPMDKSIIKYMEWFTVNFSAGLSFGKRGSEWVFFNTGINNLMDNRYKPAGLFLPAAGRSFFINLTLRI